MLTYFRPQNPQELFNLRHAQARNAIERLFGVFKRRFGVTDTAPEYPIEMQAMLIPALGAVHNFISIHDPTDTFAQDSRNSLQSPSSQSRFGEPQNATLTNAEVLGSDITAEERRRAGARRDAIANAMWKDYQVELQRRGEL